MSDLFFRSQKTSDSPRKKVVFFIMFFFTVFPLFMPKSELLSSLFADSLFTKEQITLVTLFKRANLSDSLWSLLTKEQHDQFALFPERIAISLFRSQKTSDLLKKPKSEFPTLKIFPLQNNLCHKENYPIQTSCKILRRLKEGRLFILLRSGGGRSYRPSWAVGREMGSESFQPQNIIHIFARKIKANGYGRICEGRQQQSWCLSHESREWDEAFYTVSYAGLSIRSFQKNKTFLRSFPFFIK